MKLLILEIFKKIYKKGKKNFDICGSICYGIRIINRLTVYVT